MATDWFDTITSRDLSSFTPAEERFILEIKRLRAERDTAVNTLKGGEYWPHTSDLNNVATYVAHQRRGALTELVEIHDVLAEALGYQKAPTLEEDPNCPCPGDYVTGDHTTSTLAAEAANQIVKLKRELALWEGTKKAELRREIEWLRRRCSCPYGLERHLPANIECPTHGAAANDKRLAGEKALNTLAYVRKYFMGSDHGHEV